MFVPQFRKTPYKLLIGLGVAFAMAGPINDIMTSEDIEDYREDAIKALVEDARAEDKDGMVHIEIEETTLADEMQQQFKKAQNKETAIYLLYGLTGLFMAGIGGYNLAKNYREDHPRINKNTPKPGM